MSPILVWRMRALMLDSSEMHDWIDTTSSESGPTRPNHAISANSRKLSESLILFSLDRYMELTA